MVSILQNEKECFLCKTVLNLHEHHIFYGTANRRLSEEDGMKIWLCAYHHNMSNEGVHADSKLDRQIKQIAQEKWEETYGTRKQFIERYGRNYL